LDEDMKTAINTFKKILLSLTILLGASTSSLAQENEKYVEINNGKLHVIQAGDGPYTVIFEAGFMTDLSTWQKVAPNATKNAQILVYSRAGVGKSPARTKPLSLTAHVEELKQLIAASNIKNPIVLVGHSYGGWVVRQFASTYPQQVAGLVLVDPANEELELELKKIDAQRVAQDQKRMSMMVPPSATAEFALILDILSAGKLPNTAVLPDVPTVVLTSIQEARNKPFFEETTAGLQVKRALHAKLFQQFSNGAHIVTNRSSHFIQSDEPHLVNAAIEQVLITLNKEAQKLARQQAKQLARQAVMQAIEKAKGELDKEQATAAYATVVSALKTSQFSEGEINQLGFDMLTKAKQTALAELVLRFNIEQSPQSDNAYDSYGEVLLALNRASDAKVQFEKALSLGRANPQRSPKALKGYEENLRKAELAIAKQ
jgi:pimeloyl-ACP methyl ester carboxylesterase